MKIYTRNGDEGNTTSFSGEVFRKNDNIIECLGAADELLVSLERCRLHTHDNYTKDLNKIIEAIYQLMAELSNGKAAGLSKTIQNGYVERLERRIDEMNIKPSGFVYFETLQGVDTSEARVRTRKLERKLTELLRNDVIRPTIYKYINRLSDYLFTLSCVLEEDNK